MQATTFRVKVTRKTVEALDICSYELASVDGSPLPPFSAGSHLDVQLPNGLTRQYSLCNDPAESHRYVIGVLKAPDSRGGSRAMHDAVAEGDTLTISAPKNHFPLAHEARRSLLLAGGIGITPILCMAQRLHVIGAEFALHYCSRSRERTAFHDRIRNSGFAGKAAFHFDDGEASQKLDLAGLLAKPESGTHLYVCGPRGYMDAVLGTARARGWPEQQLHYEFFSGEASHLATDGSFEVKLASSGKVISIGKEQTVVQALAQQGIEIPTSCEQGVCGTCLTRLLEGEADHRDMYLTPQEHARHDQFLPCCSRAKSPLLVLDL